MLAQWFRALLEDLSLFLSTPIRQLAPACCTLVPGAVVVFGLLGHLHSCGAHTHTQTQLNTFKLQKEDKT